MTPPVYGLCFTCLFMASIASLQQSLVHFETHDVGGTVSLRCLCQDNVSLLYYWYKQTLGEKPKLLSSYYKHSNTGTFHNEFINNPRFSLDTSDHNNHLTISNLLTSDSATYYCVKSNLYDFEFCKGVTVDVKGSGSNIRAVVHQSESETVHSERSVTLYNCIVHPGTCDGEHSVHWFKDFGESHPGTIYTNGDRNYQCERKTETQIHTCVYNLPVKNLTRSHAGSYYCAVASCGHILFGNWSTAEYGDMEEDQNNQSYLVLVYFLCGALTLTTLLVGLLALSLFKMYKSDCLCTDSNVTFSTATTANTEDEENLHYAALRDHKFNKSGKPRDERTKTECVYSIVTNQ